METPSRYVALCYRRSTGELSTGHIFLVEQGVEPTEEEVLEGFTDLPYKEMISRFSAALAEHPDVGGCIQRTDRAGLLPYFLHKTELETLRKDPVTYIRNTTFTMESAAPGKGTTVRRGTPVVVTPPLRAGFDALAEGFGEELYVRRRGEEFECPGCGFWRPTASPQHEHCKLEMVLTLRPVNDNWISVQVLELAKSNAPRFYFPREWNVWGSWITREHLREMYHRWLKEKETAT